MRTTLLTRALIAGCAVAWLGACGDATSPSGLTVRADATELREAQTTTLVALLDGRTVPASEVAWVSRDTSTVDVRGSTATARAPGEAWMVAQVGAMRDSVRLVVRFPMLPGNTMATRIAGLAGQAEHRFSLSGVSLQFERSQPVSTLVHAVAGRPANALPDDLFAGDTIVSMRLPGGLALGTHRIGAFEVRFDRNIGFWGNAGVFVAMEESTDGSSRAYYVAVDSVDVEITALTLPAQSGPGTGTVSGRMAFQAAGLRVRSVAFDKPLVIEPMGTETFPVYIEFTTTVYRVPLSVGAMEITGTPYADTIPAGGEARMTERGLEIRNALLLHADLATPTYIEPTIVVPTPGIGTFSFADTTQARFTGFFAPFLREPGPCCSGQIGERTPFAARTGGINITSYRAPTAMAYGELVAEVDAPLLDFGSAHADYRTNIAWVMRVPIRPVTTDYVP